MDRQEKRLSELRKLRSDGFYVCSMIEARKILHDVPNDFSVLNTLGCVLANLERFDESKKVLNKAIEQAANQEQLHTAFTSLGVTCYLMGAYSEGEEWCKKAFDLSVKSLIDLAYYAECLIKKGHYSGVIQLLSKAVTETSTARFVVGRASAYYVLGRAYRAIERYDDATECFQYALSLDNEYEVASDALKDVLQIHEEIDEDEKAREIKRFRDDDFPACAMVLAREFLHDMPDNFFLLTTLGLALNNLERFDEAIEVIENAIQVANQDQMYRALEIMASIYHDKGAFNEAEDWYTKAFDLRTPHTIDLNYYSECLMKRSDFTGAIELLSKAENKKESEFYTLGRAYRAIEQYDDAAECFQKALSFDKEYESVDEALRDILKMQKSKKEP